MKNLYLKVRVAIAIQTFRNFLINVIQRQIASIKTSHPELLFQGLVAKMLKRVQHDSGYQKTHCSYLRATCSNTEVLIKLVGHAPI